MTLLLSPDSLSTIIINIQIQKQMELSSKKKVNTCIGAEIVTRGSIHRQADVTFHNFFEVNFRDFLLTGSKAD